jgi:hypothetical protein
MKDNRFLELVNIYLDGEISDAETAELEQEIRSSPGRLDQYRRYCRMQKACLQLAQHHRETVSSGHTNIVHLPETRRAWVWGQWWRGGVYAGTAAIAATVILVISMSGPVAVVPEAPAPEVASSDMESRIVQIPIGEFSRRTAAEPRLASLTDRWSALTRLEAVSFPASLNSPQTPEFNQRPAVTEWTSAPFISPRGPLEFRYESDSISGARVLHGQPRGADSEAEFTTFQFAR